MVDEGRLRLAGPSDELIASHDLITAPVPKDGDGEDGGRDRDRGEAALSAQFEGRQHTVVGARAAGRTLTALIRPGSDLPENWIAATPTLEDVVLGYMRNPSAPPLLIAAHQDAAAGPDRKVPAL
jgi:ABC-2 type transport system ATP-binding protein